MNGKLRKERRQSINKEYDDNSYSNKRNITHRSTSNNREDDGDNKKSPTKRQRTVQFKDDDEGKDKGQDSNDEYQESQQGTEETVIKNRREVLSFRINAKE